MLMFYIDGYGISKHVNNGCVTLRIFVDGDHIANYDAESDSFDITDSGYNDSDLIEPIEQAKEFYNV